MKENFKGTRMKQMNHGRGQENKKRDKSKERKLEGNK